MISLGSSVYSRRSKPTIFLLVAAISLLAAYLVFFWDSVSSLPEHIQNKLPSPSEFFASKPGDEDSSGPAASSWSSLAASPSTAIDTTPTKDDLTGAPSSRPSSKHGQCIDPYRQPGYLFVGPGIDYNQTRWIPYTAEFLDADDPTLAQYPYDVKTNGNISFDENSKPEDAYFDHQLTPMPWMNMMVEEGLRRKNSSGGAGNGTLGWLDNRVVVIVSDSVDRFNTEWFCREFRDRTNNSAKFIQGNKFHSWAKCAVPSFNLTILHWHLAGMMPYNPSGWWNTKNELVPFEERWEKTWSKTLDEIGKEPNLIIWQSSVWDRKNWLSAAQFRYGEKSAMARHERQLVWDEIRFYAARVQKFIRLMQDAFPNVPMMLRTITLDGKNPAKDIQLYDMDRVNRAIGQRYGVEPFEWGKLIAGHRDMYRDNLHPKQGAANWLWSTMILEYLARATGAGTRGGSRKEREPYYDGWKECHGQLI